MTKNKHGSDVVSTNSNDINLVVVYNSAYAQKSRVKSARGKNIKTSIAVVALVSIMLIMSGIVGININHCAKNSASAMSGAQGMAVLEVSTGRVLYSKNMHKQLAPASTTKILTAIVVIENITDLDKIIEVPAAAVGVEGSSIYLEKGEKLSVRDLLYGLMLQSGNDCATALALHVSGSKEKFAELMNETAKKAGAQNSNFVTPHGLDAPGHMTTAFDLAIISAYALRNEEFAQISKTKKHSAPYANRDYNRVIVNKNRLLSSYDGADGVKTGYTKKAGRTFVASATRDNMQVVCVVLNCGPMFEESARLMTAAFTEFGMTSLTHRGDIVANVKVEKGRVETTPVGASKIAYYPLRKNEISLLSSKVVLPQSIKAPTKVGTEIGELQIMLENELIYTVKLVNIEAVDSYNLKDMLKEIADSWTR